MAEDSKSRTPPAFFSSDEFKEGQMLSFAKHRSSPELSLDAYLASKDLALRKALSAKKVFYLDTNHWVNLRHVVLKSRLQKAVYCDMLELLTELHNKGRVCCPISFLLFHELMKQNDPITRTETARLMDRFSDGVCFLFPPEMARSELRHFLLGRIPQLNIGPKAWIWTKVGFIGGQLFPTLPNVPDETSTLMQKAWADFMWDITLEQLLSIGVGSFGRESDFWDKYAVASNADAVFYRSSNLGYSDVLLREKGLLIRELLRHELAPVSQEIINSFPDFADPRTLRPVSEDDYSPLNFPSLQILAGISAAHMLSKMKFEANDMLDFRHAALAIPYCDAVCCDNPMATCLRNKPCEFGKIYGTRIFGRAEEINAFLRTLK